MKLKLLMVLFLCTLACIKPRSGGDYREIAVIADEPTWTAVESTLVLSLERRVTLLEKESIFWVHWYTPDMLETARRRPALLLLGTADNPGIIGRAISSIVGDSLSAIAEKQPFMKLEDPWARGQKAFILVSETGESLNNTILSASSRLFDELYTHYETQVRERLYYRGPHLRQAQHLRDSYDWSIETPRPWQMIESDSTNLVRFVKSQPDRFMFIFWTSWEDSTFRAEYCLKKRRDLVWEYYDEDEVDDDRTYFTWTDFQGRKALEITGAWINWKTTSGGPFRTICFIDEIQQRLYMIDLSTFAPDRPKLYPMTQLGIIAETFRAGKEPGPFATGEW